jgi:CRISPR-associated protein Csd1
MLLTALKQQYAESDEKLPEFHARQEVRYAVDLDADGTLESIRPLPERTTLTIPYFKRAYGIVPLPLDRGDYVLGVPPKSRGDGDSEKARVRTAAAHAAYVLLMREAAAETGLDGFAAIHRFASTVDPAALDLPDGFDAARFVAVYVDRRLPVHDPRAQEWWIRRQQQTGPGPAVCGVCGTSSSPVEFVPVPIRGLTRIGGRADMSLVSGNIDVFERHGMVRASGASICLSCGNATHQMLNQFLADPKHALVLGNSIYVWWPTEPVDDLLLDAVLWGDGNDDVRAVLESLTTGQLVPESDASRFIAVSLGANAARVVVRSWTNVTLGAAFENIRRWFARIAIVQADGSQPRRYGVFPLLASIAPPGSRSPLSRLNPGLPDTVMTAAITGGVLPPSLLAYALGRIRARQGEIRAPTAALVKACLISPTHPHPEEAMTDLDGSSQHAAYLCGRLLALLDNAARLATTRNNALVDRSYSAASTMPQITFTRLLRLHRAHLDKLRRDKPGAAARIDGTVTEILAGVDDLPRTLSVEQQARFALGLYHQQAADHAAIRRAKEAKALGTSTDLATLEREIEEEDE